MSVTMQILRMKVFKCPSCKKPKRCLVDENGKSTKMKCEDCKKTFQMIEPGKWKITRS